MMFRSCKHTQPFTLRSFYSNWCMGWFH